MDIHKCFIELDCQSISQWFFIKVNDALLPFVINIVLKLSLKKFEVKNGKKFSHFYEFLPCSIWALFIVFIAHQPRMKVTNYVWLLTDISCGFYPSIPQQLYAHTQSCSSIHVLRKQSAVARTMPTNNVIVFLIFLCLYDRKIVNRAWKIKMWVKLSIVFNNCCKGSVWRLRKSFAVWLSQS